MKTAAAVRRVNFQRPARCRPDPWGTVGTRMGPSPAAGTDAEPAGRTAAPFSETCPPPSGWRRRGPYGQGRPNGQDVRTRGADSPDRRGGHTPARRAARGLPPPRGALRPAPLPETRAGGVPAGTVAGGRPHGPGASTMDPAAPACAGGPGAAARTTQGAVGADLARGGGDPTPGPAALAPVRAEDRP